MYSTMWYHFVTAIIMVILKDTVLCESGFRRAIISDTVPLEPWYTIYDHGSNNGMRYTHE